MSGFSTFLQFELGRSAHVSDDKHIFRHPRVERPIWLSTRTDLLGNQELMRSWQRLVEADERRKSDRVDRANEKATDRWDRALVGDHVFLRNWYRRRKSDPQFVGLYVVASKLRRYRLRVRDSATGRTQLVHVQQLLAQQASMAAQATTQLGSNPVATAIQWLNTLMMQAINVPEFEGESAMLTDFLERGTCIMSQVTGSGLDEGSARAVRQMLIGRTSIVVRRELGINVTEQWDAVVKRLKEGYGGARKSYQRQVVSLILTGRHRDGNIKKPRGGNIEKEGNTDPKRIDRNGDKNRRIGLGNRGTLQMIDDAINVEREDTAQGSVLT
ncbi:hypothetical protein AAG570_008154 [Ranatra chinensis]|uniref:Uncharacterized protein n=1 Tax=Ranatra chinensis TaxID=642074 RepID=A0ABD0XTW8_9HEMI